MINLTDYLKKFGTTSIELQDILASKYKELAIISTPWIYLGKDPALVRKYFPEYKTVEDFDRTEWMKEALVEWTKKKLGNMTLVIGGFDGSGKSSVGLDLHQWIMTRISGRQRYDIRNFMFRGICESFYKMPEVQPMDCLFQYEEERDHGVDSQSYDNIQREQDEALDGRRIHKIQIRRIHDPKKLLSVRAHFYLITWDAYPASEPPPYIEDMEKELSRLRDEARKQYRCSELGWNLKDYKTKKEEFRKFLVDEYAPILREFYQEQERVHRAILFLEGYNGTPHFLGFTLHPTVKDKDLLEEFLIEKEIYQLELMTGEIPSISYV